MDEEFVFGVFSNVENKENTVSLDSLVLSHQGERTYKWLAFSSEDGKSSYLVFILLSFARPKESNKEKDVFSQGNSARGRTANYNHSNSPAGLRFVVAVAIASAKKICFCETIKNFFYPLKIDLLDFLVIFKIEK